MSFEQFKAELNYGNLTFKHGFAAECEEKRPPTPKLEEPTKPQPRRNMRKKKHRWRGQTKTWAEWAEVADMKFEKLLDLTLRKSISDVLEKYVGRQDGDKV